MSDGVRWAIRLDATGRLLHAHNCRCFDTVPNDDPKCVQYFSTRGTAIDHLDRIRLQNPRFVYSLRRLTRKPRGPRVDPGNGLPHETTGGKDALMWRRAAFEEVLAETSVRWDIADSTSTHLDNWKFVDDWLRARIAETGPGERVEKPCGDWSTMLRMHCELSKGHPLPHICKRWSWPVLDEPGKPPPHEPASKPVCMGGCPQVPVGCGSMQYEPVHYWPCPLANRAGT